MKNKLVYFLAFIITFSGGIVLGFYIRNQIINPRATLPNILERTLAFLINKGKQIDEDLLFHDAELVDFIINGSAKTKVTVEGTVDKIVHEPDGDYHIIMRPQHAPAGLFLVTKFIPEIRNLPLPKEGDHIKIWGITRFDKPHNWWELTLLSAGKNYKIKKGPACILSPFGPF